MKKSKILSVLSVGLLVSTAVSCGGNAGAKIQETLNSAIGKLIVSQNNTDVTANFAVAAIIKHEGVTYDIAWTSSNATVASFLPNSATQKSVNISRPSYEEGDVDVVLTAKISQTEGSSTYYATKEFNIRVLALEEDTAGTASVADLKTAINTGYTSGSNSYVTNFGNHELTVVGILTGKGILLADNTGVVYAYGSYSDLAVGDKITIQETKAYRYYGCPQLTNISYTKTGSGATNPAVAATNVSVDELYSLLTAAGNDAQLLDASLFSYFQVTGQVAWIEDKYITLVDPADPTNQKKWLSVYNYNTDYAELEKVIGATVTINVQLHDVYKDFSFSRNDGGVSTTPSATIFRVNYFDGPIDVTLTDEQAANITLTKAIKDIMVSYSSATTVNLSDTVTWSLDSAADTSVYALSGNTLTIAQGEQDKTATLTASVEVGGQTYTKSKVLTVEGTGSDEGSGEGSGTVTPSETVAAPITFDASTMANIDNGYNKYADLKLNDKDFTLSCGNKYTSNGNAVAVGINKQSNLSKAGQLSAAVKTALGDKFLTGSTHINASLEMDFDLSNVNSITYNFLKVGYSTSQATALYILRSVDSGATYEIVATADSKATSISYSETSTASKVRYAFVVTGGTDNQYGAYARVSTIVVA